jgi:hypothetical protein
MLSVLTGSLITLPCSADDLELVFGGPSSEDVMGNNASSLPIQQQQEGQQQQQQQQQGLQEKTMPS